MNIAASFVQELTGEAEATRRVLERVPEGQLGWQPHSKSMTLGQLALHVATLPRQIMEFISADSFDFAAANFTPPAPASSAELLAAFETSLAEARAYLEALTDERAQQIWTLTRGQASLMALPRAAVVRSFLFNHLYHHRGQLLVYLRLLEIPVPSVYGPSADESPFGSSP